MVIVEALVILCSSPQNCSSIIANKGVGVLVTIMKMNALQFCFELHCKCWKLLTMMIEKLHNQVSNIVKYTLIEQSLNIRLS